ncbi:MAG: hypothetical protein JNK85_17255 [Verrucomicrobiales bacterium]|nr:hypothetical protein [Verrucomicrobiales bacterium]
MKSPVSRPTSVAVSSNPTPGTTSRFAVAVRRLALPLALLAATPAQLQTVPPFDPAGLWVGDVTLNQVSNARNGTLEPTASTAQLRLLLHSDATGKVRLLKEVIVARNSTNTSEILLLSDPARLAQFPVARDTVTSAPLAQRISTASIDFTDNDGTPDNALDLAGSLSTASPLTGTLTLGPRHPSNPFRHPFHPDHSNEGAQSYTITHHIQIQLAALEMSVNGTPRFTGTYQQTVEGLHKAALKASGTLVLSRLASTAALNP